MSPARRRRARVERRRTLARRAVGWQTLIGAWCLTTVGVGVAGWQLVGAASLCCPLLMVCGLVVLVVAAAEDMRQQIGAGPGREW